MASVYLSPVSGALFAALSYLLFASGYFKGELFPVFRGTTPVAARTPHSHMTNYLWQMEPSTAADLAKLLIWGFVAGFAERLIPDTLNRMITRRLDGVINAGVPAGSLRTALQDLMRGRGEAERGATEAKKAAETRAAEEKAAAEATRKKEEAETRAIVPTVTSPDDQAALARRAAEEKAVAEAEATRK